MPAEAHRFRSLFGRCCTSDRNSDKTEICLTSTTNSAADAATENFADLLAESFGEGTNVEGSVVRGFVIGIEGDAVVIDVGLKSEGRVPLKELAAPGQQANVSIGDEIEVYVERMEDRNGQAILSRDKARREEAWGVLEASFEKQERVTGIIFGKVKGGFTVDLSGATAFLPGSQVDIRPVRDLGPLMGTPPPFQILKIDRRRGNIVVSRRAVLEESRAEARTELVFGSTFGAITAGNDPEVGAPAADAVIFKQATKQGAIEGSLNGASLGTGSSEENINTNDLRSRSSIVKAAASTNAQAAADASSSMATKAIRTSTSDMLMLMKKFNINPRLTNPTKIFNNKTNNNEEDEFLFEDNLKVASPI